MLLWVGRWSGRWLQIIGPLFDAAGTTKAEVIDFLENYVGIDSTTGIPLKFLDLLWGENLKKAQGK